MVPISAFTSRTVHFSFFQPFGILCRSPITETLTDSSKRSSRKPSTGADWPRRIVRTVQGTRDLMGTVQKYRGVDPTRRRASFTVEEAPVQTLNGVP